jgi:hypothetical protein
MPFGGFETAERASAAFLVGDLDVHRISRDFYTFKPLIVDDLASFLLDL